VNFLAFLEPFEFTAETLTAGWRQKVAEPLADDCFS